MTRWGLGLAVVLLGAAGCVTDEQITVGCDPGTSVSAGCGCIGLGRCNGDPVLIACDGTLSAQQCLDREGAATIGFNDDSCGLCPYLTVTCPSSGSVTFATRPFSSGSGYTCQLDTVGTTRTDPTPPMRDSGVDTGGGEPAPP